MTHGHQIAIEENLGVCKEPATVRELTIFFAPPMQGDLADERASGIDFPDLERDLQWAGRVREAIAGLVEPLANGRSQLDDIVSDAVGELVTVWQVQSVDDFPCASRSFPALIVEPASVLDARGQALERDLGDREVCASLSKALAEHTGAGLVGCQVRREDGHMVS